MPIFRCDYRVLGDLVFPTDQKVVRMKVGDGPTFTYRNEAPRDDGHSYALIVSVVGECTDVNSAEQTLRDALVENLNLLAFVMQTRLQIDEALRLIEWTPFQKKRRLIVFHTVDPRSPPTPDLTEVHIATAGQVARTSPSRAMQTAMRYFRLGMLNRSHEDQFFNLWLALEIVAESKPKTPVAVVCKQCKGAIVCAACGEAAIRTPGGRHAIEPFIRRFAVTGEEDATVRRLFEARNKLMHGSSAESIEQKCGRPLPALVDELGGVAWRAIFEELRFRPDSGEMEFGHWGGEFAHRRTITGMQIEFSHDGPEEHPHDSKIPEATITLTTRFGGKGSNSPAAPPED